MNASGAALIAATIGHGSAVRRAPSFKMPYYVIRGATTCMRRRRWRARISTGCRLHRKRYAVIEGAGHFALATHAAEMSRLLKVMVQ